MGVRWSEGGEGGSLILKSFGPIITLLVLVFTWMEVFESQLQQCQQTKTRVNDC
jgi:hypothetical protein